MTGLARRHNAAIMEDQKKNVNIYTDGGCLGNPGPGGYGVVLRYGQHEKRLSGGFRLTTNNRMEIMGAIVGLEALKGPCSVTLYSDSKYLVDAMSLGWVAAVESQRLAAQQDGRGRQPGPLGAAAGGLRASRGEIRVDQGPRRPPVQRNLRHPLQTGGIERRACRRTRDTKR